MAARTAERRHGRRVIPRSAVGAHERSVGVLLSDDTPAAGAARLGGRARGDDAPLHTALDLASPGTAAAQAPRCRARGSGARTGVLTSPLPPLAPSHADGSHRDSDAVIRSARPS